MNTDSSLPAFEQSPADETAGEYRVAELTTSWQPPPPQLRFVAFSCSSCQLRHEVAEYRAGQPITCPDCGRANVVPPYREVAASLVELTATFETHTLPMCTMPPPRPFSILHTSLFPEKVDPNEPDEPLEPETGVMLGGPRGARPRWPLIQGVFDFPFCKEQGFQVAILASWLAFELLYFDSMSRYSPLWILNLGGFLLVILLNLPFMALVSSWLIEILERTASGMDRGIGWSSRDWFDWIVDLGRISLAALLSTLLAIGLTAWTSHRGSPSPYYVLPVAMLLFPVLMLSSLETNSIGGFFSRWVWRSLWYSRSVWAGFYLLSMVLLQAIAVGNSLADYYFGQQGSILPMSILAIAGLMIYFRMLGRLVWFIPVTRKASAVDRRADGKEDHLRKLHLWWNRRSA